MMTPKLSHKRVWTLTADEDDMKDILEAARVVFTPCGDPLNREHPITKSGDPRLADLCREMLRELSS